jgi:hypothetical protein
VEALRHHRTEVHGTEGEEHPECLICELASPECMGCEQRTDDMDPEDRDRHVLVDAGTGAAEAVAIGCEEHVAPAVRAAALVEAPSVAGDSAPEPAFAAGVADHDQRSR